MLLNLSLSLGLSLSIPAAFKFQEADMAVAPLTITYSRAEVVEFTAPFLQHGISMLLRHPSEHLPYFTTFLTPWDFTLWTAIPGAIASTVLVMFLVARITPFERRHDLASSAVDNADASMQMCASNGNLQDSERQGQRLSIYEAFTTIFSFWVN